MNKDYYRFYFTPNREAPTLPHSPIQPDKNAKTGSNSKRKCKEHDLSHRHPGKQAVVLGMPELVSCMM